MHQDSKKATVWSQPSCAYCMMAQQLLERKGYTVEIKKITEGYTKEDLLKAVPTARSVPQVFIENKFVGDYQALVKHFSA